jgi:hypothetical protein
VLATLEQPVQHRKSTKLRIFVAWLIGHHGDKFFNFYTADDNLRQQTSYFITSVLNSKKYKAVFGEVLKRTTQDNVSFAKGGSISYRITGGGNTGYPSHFSFIDDRKREQERIKKEQKQKQILIQQETIINIMNKYLTVLDFL